MKYLILIALVSFTLCLSGQQNLISNGSFEERALGVLNDKPNDFSQVDKCKDWAMDNDGAVHSPDWLKDDPNYIDLMFDNQTIQANTGHHYVGMLQGELIEQKISNLQADKAYKLIFYIRLTSNLNSNFTNGAPLYGSGYSTNNYPNAKINVLLSDRKIEYKDIGSSSCEAEDEERDKYFKKNDPVIIAASIPIDIATYSPDRWYRVETYLSKGIIIPNLDWIGLEMVHEQIGNKVNLGFGNWCEKPYILIDDVELYEIDCEECKNCSYKDGCIDVGVIANDGGIGCPELINLENVSELLVEIATAGQGVVRTYYLKNPPSQFSWDLKNDFGVLVPSGTYSVSIKASNDCQMTHTEASITVVINSQSTPCTNSSTFFPVSRAAPPNGQCCGEDLYLSNIVISEDHIYRANRIIVGPDVTILSGVIVEFHAETEIDISPDLIVELGADWFAYIDENCVNDDIGRMIPISDDNTIDDEIVLDKNNAGDTINPKVKEQIDVLIYPNPTTGIVNIDRVNISNNTLIQVFDISGRLLKTKILISSQTQLDLSDYPKGTYFIRIREENRVITKKIIIQ
jgi:hypothetical protein